MNRDMTRRRFVGAFRWRLTLSSPGNAGQSPKTVLPASPVSSGRKCFTLAGAYLRTSITGESQPQAHLPQSRILFKYKFARFYGRITNTISSS
jgi:hypothetical protein